MFDEEIAKRIYKPYEGTPFYDALMDYDRKFDTLIHLNELGMVTTKELQDAVIKNKEIELYKPGLIY